MQFSGLDVGLFCMSSTSLSQNLPRYAFPTLAVMLEDGSQSAMCLDLDYSPITELCGPSTVSVVHVRASGLQRVWGIYPG
jgi:hypothetical protein